MTDKTTPKEEEKEVKTPTQPVADTDNDTEVQQNLKVDPNDPRNVPTFQGEPKEDYLDINNPKHGNKTYTELQNQ